MNVPAINNCNKKTKRTIWMRTSPPVRFFILVPIKENHPGINAAHILAPVEQKIHIEKQDLTVVNGSAVPPLEDDQSNSIPDVGVGPIIYFIIPKLKEKSNTATGNSRKQYQEQDILAKTHLRSGMFESKYNWNWNRVK